MLRKIFSRPEPVSSDNITLMLEQEAGRIRERRSILNRREERDPGLAGDPATDALGLALSGGGIRSATFNLGLLQSLSRGDVLKRADYLSTVSGGGYIGSCLTWFMSVLRQPFPFGTRRKDNMDAAGRIVAWLRDRGHYLTPGHGLNGWALAAAALSGMLANLAVLVPVFMLLVYLLSGTPLDYNGHGWMLGGLALLLPAAAQLYLAGRFPVLAGRRVSRVIETLGIVGIAALMVSTGQVVHAWLQGHYPAGGFGHIFGQALGAGVAALTLFLLLALLYAIGSRWRVFRTMLAQQVVEKSAGRLLMAGVALLIVGSIPLAYDLLAANLSGWKQSVMSSVTLGGALSVIAALRGRKQGSETRGLRALALSVGLTLAIYGLFLWFYHLLHAEPAIPGWLGYALCFSLAIGLLGNINHVSMHRFYRNRLMEAYMPEAFNGTSHASADRCLLHEIGQGEAPYHIINTNIQLTGSRTPKYRARAGDNFIFSPLYCGAGATGFVPTAVYSGGSMNLATAFAISGAAVDPNTYLTRSRPLTFLMTLFNARLGYWAHNPRHSSWVSGLFRPHWYWYIFRELFSRGLDENNLQVHLSDGGHFENLGLYELVRRRCRVIIVSDAGADPDWSFSDLARVIELVRLDFGAKVEINIEPLKPFGTDRISPRAFVEGKITYIKKDGDPGPDSATLVYIKTAMIAGLTEDINGYRRQHPVFPDETTLDQFFDEEQFEAYRELGFQIGDLVSKAYTPAKLDELGVWPGKAVTT
jgi:hypothetical protein